MVSIDLSNIIHYQPPPISKPPFKPPLLRTPSRDSSHPSFNQPFLIHPLPLRPPSPSHKSLQTPHTRRQSPSLVVSCLPDEGDTHLNEFDKELANFNLAEIESLGPPGLCSGGSQGRQADNVDNVQREELHDVHGISRLSIGCHSFEAKAKRYCQLLVLKVGSHPNDHQRDNLRGSQDVATPQDTVASSSVGSGLSSAPSPPASPCRETQLSLAGCEPEVNCVTASGSRHALTSQRNCNVSRDHRPLHSPSSSVPARDETEPASQQLLRCSSEGGAEPRKSSLIPVIKANSIQSQVRDLSPTRNSHPGVRNVRVEAQLTDCRCGNETFSSPVSPVLRQQEQTGPRSEGENTPRDLSRSCSVSVVVPVTRSHGLPIARPTRTSRAHCTRKRKSRAKSTYDVDSDDPDDGDYTDGNDSGAGDIAASPHPVKRRRRTVATKTQPTRVQRESPHYVFSSLAPEEAFANQYSATSLQDMQTIPVRGFLTRQTFLSRVVYSRTFEEDRQPSCPYRPTPTNSRLNHENLDKTGQPKRPSHKKPSAHATRFQPDEDELLIELKEKRSLPWPRIGGRMVLSKFAIAQSSRNEELDVSGEVGVDRFHVLRRRVRLHKRHVAYYLGHKRRGGKGPIQSHQQDSDTATLDSGEQLTATPRDDSDEMHKEPGVCFRMTGHNSVQQAFAP
ncbi:hypothetical protein NUU61_001318 [Penicillium alfredii]|uniref:Uncharacterized protein n=1 Tax=Penicillium alfredii TaxID=1506179 RepID=A0A9W9KN71_9EURO|nr:uncharacterized protein NUU61_001318 [Penicillium alfredii]KAJ5111688.1 hypothetical protein NUU61_001318 [Penicillium alfredii]